MKATKKQERQADAAQRAQRGWSARAAGASWAQVAELCNYASATVACRAVRRYFGNLPKIDHEEQRALCRERHELLWRQSQAGIREGQAGALRAGVAVARSASQLDGLDRPTQVELYRPDAVEFLRVVGELKERMLEGQPREADIFEAEIVVSEQP